LSLLGLATRSGGGDVGDVRDVLLWRRSAPCVLVVSGILVATAVARGLRSLALDEDIASIADFLEESPLLASRGSVAAVPSLVVGGRRVRLEKLKYSWVLVVVVFGD